MPCWAVEGATIEPASNQAQLRNDHGRIVSAKLYAAEHPGMALVIDAVTDENLIVRVGSKTFTVAYDTAFSTSWRLVGTVPERVQPPSWLRTGMAIRYQGAAEGPAVLHNVGEIRLRGTFRNRFGVERITRQYVEVINADIAGSLRAPLTADFAVNWGPCVGDGTAPAPAWLQEGSYVRPKDNDGQPLNTYSFLVTEVATTFFRAQPVYNHGVLGPAIQFPMGTAEDAWVLAPDDPKTRRDYKPGMVLRSRRTGELVEIKTIDPGTGAFTVGSLRQQIRTLTPGEGEFVLQEDQPVENVPDRFGRIE
jgi:hypothetical protein